MRSIPIVGGGGAHVPLPSRRNALSRHSGTTAGRPQKPFPPDSGGSVDHPCGRSSRGAIDAFQPTAAARSPRRRRPRGAAGRGTCARTATSAVRAPRSVAREEEGGWAWGSCGRSGRHALGRAAGASCVQRLDDSRNSAIHTTYRISLRSSSLQEPRYPLLRVVAMYFDPPGGRHLSPASVVLCAPRAPPPGAGGRKVYRAAPCLAARRRGDALAAEGGGEASLSLHPATRPTGGPGPAPHPLSPGSGTGARSGRPRLRARPLAVRPRFAVFDGCVSMILPQVHLRKPCYDFSFL